MKFTKLVTLLSGGVMLMGLLLVDTQNSDTVPISDVALLAENLDTVALNLISPENPDVLFFC